MSQKLVKTKRTELLEMRAHLNAALKEALHAQELASTLATCCEASLDGLVREIEQQIAQIDNHMEKGFLPEDLV